MSLRVPALPAVVLGFLGSAFAQPVLINEVSYDAPGGDGGSVFVELYGTPGFDISGWTLQAVEGSGTNSGTNNNESFVFPPGTVIPNDGFLVIADDDGSGSTNVPNADIIVGDMDLENGPDGLQLIDTNNGRLVDAVAYGAVTTTINTSNGFPYVLGNPTRDFFAPLSIERCPAGSNTRDNSVDFRPNFPTPGTGESCCTAIEWVNQGPGNSISAMAGEAVGLDVFFDDCAANNLYFLVASIVDPALMPPPPPFPVFDPLGTPLFLGLINTPPLVNWSGILDADGNAVGQASVDFSAVTVMVPASLDLWVGGIALDQSLQAIATNSVMLTILQ